MSDDLRRRLAVTAALTRPDPTVKHEHPQLYRIALGILARAARMSDHHPFQASDARRALAAAADSLASPLAADYGPQPDPADVAAFLRRLQDDEITSKGPAGYLIHFEAMPF